MRKITKLHKTRIAALLIGTTLLGGGHALADEVIPDDLIVQGSTCTGFDCVNNESFGFATLRLKENNLRIDFTDTSGGGNATRDWRLEANSRVAGGPSFFAIKDMGDSANGDEGGTAIFTATAAAPANSLFISNTGNVGLGTASPGLDLHINTTDTAALRLEQNAGGGFGAQTWDIGANEANFFVRDVTGGSRLPLRIRPGAPTSSVDINAAGDVGVGTASPVTKLHLFNSGAANVVASFENGSRRWSVGVNAGTNAFRIADNTAAAARITLDTTGQVGIGTDTLAAQLHTTGSVRFAGVANCAAGIVSNAAGTLSCAVSSARFKDIRGALTAATATANVMALRPQVGSYKETPEVPEHWLIAEDVAAVDSALAGFRDGAPYTVKTQNVVADLVAVIQDQQRRIEALEKAIAAR
jgi:hypothetical protein